MRFIILVFALLILSIRPLAAQAFLSDAETEILFTDMMDPLTVAAGLNPGQVRVHLLHDNSINAFVAGSQDIYIHTGLIKAADTANEVQGVLAHELGHIMGGHAIRTSEGIRTATNYTLISMLLGIAALASGAGDAGIGILAAGQQAALGSFLAFSRTQEATADAAGAHYLSTAEMSGKGSLSFFRKLQNLEFRYPSGRREEQGYSRTHPLTSDRIRTLRESYRHDAAWDKPNDADIEKRFQRMKAKLLGYVLDPPQTLRIYPIEDRSIPARYARAYAWHKGAYLDQALTEINSLIVEEPNNPYFLELKGQLLLESGQPTQALAPLRRAVNNSRAHPLIATLLGHALVATEDPRHYDEARRVLKTAVALGKPNPFAWYQLGVVYTQQGDEARAALASAERYSLQRDGASAALHHAQIAVQRLPEGSPDWIRAQDIALVARTALENPQKKQPR